MYLDVCLDILGYRCYIIIHTLYSRNKHFLKITKASDLMSTFGHVSD